jgi:DMSO reductase anchor subunit
MSTHPTSAPAGGVALIPETPQTLWRWPAVANFLGGGLGAGFYVGAAVAGRPAAAAWLGPALVLAGFLAVATEAGRPLRGIRVLARLRTSWMSRELWLGGAFAVVAASEPLTHLPGQRLLASALALGYVLAQGLILRQARAIAAWSVPVLPLLFLTSALVSGAGLVLLVETLGGGLSPRLLGGTLTLTTLDVVAWQVYLTWSREAAFRRGVQPLREGPLALAVVGAGHVGPLFLLALALTLPAASAVLAAAGALSLLAGQTAGKAGLILVVGRIRAITIPHLTLDRRSA